MKEHKPYPPPPLAHIMGYASQPTHPPTLLLASYCTTVGSIYIKNEVPQKIHTYVSTVDSIVYT